MFIWKSISANFNTMYACVEKKKHLYMALLLTVVAT